MSLESDLNIEELPKTIKLAALTVATQYLSLGMFGPQEAQSKRQEINLWLFPSWKNLSSLGCSEECFAELVLVDKWNVSSNPALLEDFKHAFSLVRNDAWKIYACNMTASQAAEEIKQVGVEDFLAGIEAVLALKKMSS